MPSSYFFRKIFFAVAIFSGHYSFADEVKYIAHGEQALAEYIAIIESASHSIDFVTFIFEPCHASTQILMDGLARKARAGVKVRVLLDVSTQSQEQKQNIVDGLTADGIEVRIYNDFSVYGIQMNLRIHAKTMVVDGKTYMTGGRNWSDEYFNLSTKENWVDRDVLVTGASVTQATASFNELWNSKMVTKRASYPEDFIPWQKFCPSDISVRVREVKNYFAKNSAAILGGIPARNCPSVKYFTDNPEFGNPRYNGDDPGEYMSSQRLQQKRTSNRFLKFMDGTETSFISENWSYLPYGRINESLVAMKARGVAIDFLTNMTLDGPDLLRQAEEYAIDRYVRRDNNGNQRVRRMAAPQLFDSYALTPPSAPFLVHSKVYLRDGKDVIVSSYNLDPRSYSTNVEAMTYFKNCPALAADIESGFQVMSDKFDKDTNDGRIYEMEPISAAAKILAAIFFLFL